jgi:ABC-2 type transport system permease protein
MKLLNSIRRIFLIVHDEAIDVVHDRGVLIFILFVPICYPLLYSYVYTNERLFDVPAVIVDDCNSSLSRQLIRNIDATPDVKIASHCNNMEEAKSLVKNHKAYGIIHIPSWFDKDIWNGEQTRIGVYCDMSSMLYYKAILLACTDVTLEMNNDIKNDFYLKSKTKRDEEVNKMPIQYTYKAMFNTQSGFASFLIPPVIMLIFQQTLLLGIGMSMGRTRERNKGHIFPPKPYYHHAFEIVIGKTIFYYSVYILMAIYTFEVVNRIFGLPQLGDYWHYTIFVSVFLLACIMLSFVLSVFVYRREDCIMLFVFASVPLLFLSGVSWPTPAMPKFWVYVSYLFPSTFGMNGYVRISSMGADLHQIGSEMRGLIWQTGIYFILSCLLYGNQILKIRRGDNQEKG